MDNPDIFKLVQTDFSNLMNWKERGNRLEIITPFATLNNKFISVFVHLAVGKYIMSDGGSLNDNTYYSDEKSHTSNKKLNKIFLELQKKFEIHNNTDFYYKDCHRYDLHLISARVFDMANFINAVINAKYLFGK